MEEKETEMTIMKELRCFLSADLVSTYSILLNVLQSIELGICMSLEVRLYCNNPLSVTQRISSIESNSNKLDLYELYFSSALFITLCCKLNMFLWENTNDN